MSDQETITRLRKALDEFDRFTADSPSSDYTDFVRESVLERSGITEEDWPNWNWWDILRDRSEE